MKLMVAFCAVTALAIVYAETCNHHSDCHDRQPAITTCSHHTHVACDGGWCECTTGPLTDHACNALSDCSDVQCPHNGNVHCVDGNCQCTDPHGHGPPP
ncbi:serine protease inhibitor Cvsi-2-like [Mercenaria mercenaria]|uniref:serine protease inhibitor Cvsi-2-like n=1 Tax=Mercenaria mercenaria TaxID=6596 RepID=UPI001E1DF360|nr:serine protease inhibitor Cvsi-2-like [Mercenaria mercenaria]